MGWHSADREADEVKQEPTCLLVDDDTFARTYMALILQRMGYFVSDHGSVTEARMACSQFVFDLAVLDALLPDGSGVVFADELACPIIFTTGATDEFNRKVMWKRGVVYQKPVDSSFNECVKRVTEKGK